MGSIPVRRARNGADGMRRNLLRNADFHTLNTVADSAGNTLFRMNGHEECVSKLPLAYGGSDGGQVVIPSTGSAYQYVGFFFTAPVEPGKTYTASVMAKGSASNVAIFELIASKGGANSSGRLSSVLHAVEISSITSEWKKYKYTITIPTTSDETKFLEVNFWMSGVGDLCICQPKLEEGKTATDFCLNEEDLRGRGITDSDVMFTASEDTPTWNNGTGWVTDDDGLIKPDNKDKTLYQCTKVTYTDGEVDGIGIMALGLIGDMADVTELYCNGTSTPSKPTSHTALGSWKTREQFSTVKGQYVYTCSEIKWRDGTYTYTDVTVAGYTPLDGVDTEHYELVATPAQFHVDKNGNCPDTVVVKMWHVKGSKRTEVGTTDKILHVEFDANVCGDYALPATLDPNKDDAIGQPMFSDEYTAYYECTIESDTYGSLNLRIPVMRDGKTGENGDNAITIDLDNEMDSVPCDADGTVMADTTIQTTATLYNGAGVETSAESGWQDEQDLSIGGVSPDSAVVSKGVATIKWKFTKGTKLTSGKYTVDIPLYYNNNTYTTVFTLNAVKSGAKGESPVIYQLLPSLTSLTFKYTGTAYSPTSLPLTCGYTRRKGDTVETVSDITTLSSKVIDSTYRIYWRTKLYNGTWGSYGQLTSKITVSAAAIALVTDYEFCLSTAASADDVKDSNIFDRETIPIVKDGLPGQTGTSISNADVIFVTGDSDTTEPTDEEFANNGKTLAKDVQSELGKYLWQGTKVTYSDGSTAYSGKMCLGKWDDLITGVEMYTLTDDGTTKPVVPGNSNAATWKSSFTPTKGKYLWETTRITDSSNNRTYTTPQCIGYFGTDGDDMEFNIKGTAVGFYQGGQLVVGKSTSDLINSYFSGISYTPEDGDLLLYNDTGSASVYKYTESSKTWTNDSSQTLVKGDLWLVSNDKDETYGGHVFMYVTDESKSASTGVATLIGAYWNDLGKLQGPKGDPGPTGPEGPGDYNIFKLSVVKDDNMAIPTDDEVNQGTSKDPFVKGEWNADPQGVSEDWPYEYVSTRKRTDGVWGAYSKPALYANYSANANPNLLDQADFKSENQMDKWTKKSANANGNADTYTNDSGSSISHIRSGGKDGHNFYGDQNIVAGATASNYKEVLEQPVLASGITKIEPLTWYTLSFWERCGSTTKWLSWTSSSGTFPTQSLYLCKAHIYMLYIGGYVSKSGETLMVYLYDSNGSAVAKTGIQATSLNQSVLPYTPTSDGAYTLGVKLLASDGTSDGTGTATIQYVRMHDTTEQGAVYVYPTAIDTSTVYLDGVECSSYATDMRTSIKGNQWNESGSWRQHVITFKTTSKTAMGSTDKLVLFRLMPTPIDGQKAYLQICMPKLEKGKIATSFSKSESDNVGIDGMLIRDSIWQLGNTYRNDRNKDSWPRILDVVYIERSDGSGYNVWMYNSDDPTVATADNKPSVSAAGLAIDGGLWKAVHNFGPLYTPLLIADNAEFKFGQTNRLLIINSKQEIQGCFGGVEDETNGYPLWIGGATAASAKFKVKYDGTLEATGATITGKITADVGEIGGFTISANGLTNIVSKDAMDKSDMGYIICRNDYYGRFAGIGANVLPASSGAAAVARFENNDSHSWYSQNIAMILQAQGVSSWGYDILTKNIACATYGGCFTGFALGVKIINVTSDKSVTLTTSDNVVTVIGTSGKTLNLYLPNVHSYDDGHVIIIKRDSDVNINVHPNSFVYNSVTRSSYIRYDKGAVICGSANSLPIKSWMDSMMFIFHAGLNVVNNRTTYYGSWLQYKLPRNW